MKKLLLIIPILLSTLFLPVQQPVSADSPQLAIVADIRDVTFTCPGEISFDVYIDFASAFYIRAYDLDTNTLLYENNLGYVSSTVTNSYSFNLPDPLPSTVILEVYQYSLPVFHVEPTDTKAPGLASLFQPEMPIYDAGTLSGPPLPGYVMYETLRDSESLPVPECDSITGCSASLPVYGTALVTKQQVMYANPNGEVVKDENGVPLLLLHDVDNDGADTYLILDIATGAEGETWLGLFIGGCDPVYVELQNVFPLGAIPVE